MVNLVFAITGTLSVLCSGHLLLYFGIDSATMGNIFYWLSRIFTLFLCYQCLLIVVAVPFGQFRYFWYLQKKMLKRVGFNLDWTRSGRDRKTVKLGQPTMKWCVYILECVDGTLYTGITSNIRRRLEQHGKGVGARYTRGRLPVTLLYSEKYIDRASAARREAQIKKLSRLEKIGLIQA